MTTLRAFVGPGRTGRPVTVTAYYWLSMAALFVGMISGLMFIQHGAVFPGALALIAGIAVGVVAGPVRQGLAVWRRGALAVTAVGAVLLGALLVVFPTLVGALEMMLVVGSLLLLLSRPTVAWFATALR